MKILMVSSSGGHWVQLMRTKPAFEGHHLLFASTEPDYAKHNPEQPFFTLPEASRWNKLRLIWQAARCLVLLARIRPAIVITTGASVGLFSLIAGKLVGARTIWLDSIANTAELSMSGQKAHRFADLYLTQWPELASERGPKFEGCVI